MIRVKVRARFRIKVRFSSMIMINWIRFTIILASLDLCLGLDRD